MGAARKPAAAGAFRPAVPKDSDGVMRLFAIAGRAVCARPETLDEVSRTVARAVEPLVPPESLAAQECVRLWEVFARVATTDKATLREEAGKALHRDVERLAQRLDLVPLDEWQRLPDRVDDTQPVQSLPQRIEGDSTLDDVRGRAKAKARKRSSAPLKASDVFVLLGDLNTEARASFLERAVHSGTIGRNEANLLRHRLHAETKVGKGEDVVVETLEKLGRELVR